MPNTVLCHHLFKYLIISSSYLPSLEFAIISSIYGRVVSPIALLNCSIQADQINLCQIRLNCSSLNDHSYTKSCIESPSCSYSDASETPLHFFLDCLNHQDNYLAPLSILFAHVTHFRLKYFYVVVQT